MKVSYCFSRFCFLGASALLLVRNQVSAKPRSYWDGFRGIVKACDDFDGEREIVASGTITFLRPLKCEAPMVREKLRTARPGEQYYRSKQHTACITDQSQRFIFARVWNILGCWDADSHL